MEVVTYAHPIGVGEEEVSVWTFSVDFVVHGVDIQCRLHCTRCGHSVLTPLYTVWVHFVSSRTLQVKDTVPVLPPKQQVHHKSNAHNHV